MKLNKIILNFLVLFISFNLFGCSKKESKAINNEQNKNNSSDINMENAKLRPYEKYPTLVTYTLGKTSGNYNQLKGTPYENDTDENNAWTRYALKKLNIQNENIFEANSGDDYEQKVSMAIVSGNIPDIMAVSDYETLKQLYENDMIADLTTAYENCASDKIKEIYNSYGNSFLDRVTFDGKLMALPTTEISHGPGILWLRKDWLDELSLSPPKTLSDIENILIQFKEKKPNGIPHEGLVVSSELVGKSGGSYQVNNIFSVFGAYPTQWIDDGTGKAIYGTIQPEVKEGLKVLNNWYENGLIDKQFAVRTQDDRKALLTSGKSGAVLDNWWGAWEVRESLSIDENAKWIPVLAPFDENGKLKMYTGNPHSSYIVVRKDFQYPELLMKLASLRFDYVLYKENDNDSLKEILDYQKYAGGFALGDILPTNIKPFNDFPEQGVRVKYAIENNDDKNLNREDKAFLEACKNTMKHELNGTIGDLSEWAHYYSLVKASTLVLENENKIEKINPIFFGNTPSMALKWPTLIKMEQEMLLKIITGEESISSFDEFVSSWKKTGGDEITEEVNKEIANK